MAGIYSVRLLEGGFSGGGSASSGVVPAGHTWVLRDLCAFFFAGGVETAGVTDSAGHHAWFTETTGAYQFFVAQGRVVFPAGDEITIAASGGDWDFILSGYDLAQ